MSKTKITNLQNAKDALDTAETTLREYWEHEDNGNLLTLRETLIAKEKALAKQFNVVLGLDADSAGSTDHVDITKLKTAYTAVETAKSAYNTAHKTFEDNIKSYNEAVASKQKALSTIIKGL